MLSSLSSSKESMDSRASSQSKTLSAARAGMSAISSSSAGGSQPAAASVGATCQASRRPRLSNSVAIRSSRSVWSTGSAAPVGRTELLARAVSRCHCSEDRHWCNGCVTVSNFSTASSSCAAARCAAAAGLLSSCASPAAILPSDASLSRCCEKARSVRSRAATERTIWVATDGQVLIKFQNVFFGS